MPGATGTPFGRRSSHLGILDAVKSDGKLRTANVLLADLKQMLHLAAEREIIENSPIEKRRLNCSRSTDHRLSARRACR